MEDCWRPTENLIVLWIFKSHWVWHFVLISWMIIKFKQKSWKIPLIVIFLSEILSKFKMKYLKTHKFPLLNFKQAVLVRWVDCSGIETRLTEKQQQHILRSATIARPVGGAKRTAQTCQTFRRPLGIFSSSSLSFVNNFFLYIYYSKEVKGQRKFVDHFCKYVFTCVNIIFFFFLGGGGKLVSNQKVFCVFCSWPIKTLFCH